MKIAYGLVWVLMAVPAVAAPAPKGAATKDRDRLQGTWAVVSTEYDGKVNAAPAKGDEAVFKDGKLVLTLKGKALELTFDLAPGDDPKGIVLIPKDAPGVNYHLQGIYKLDGDDLSLCWALPVKEDKVGMRRPTQFKTQAGSFAVLVTLKRVKGK